MPSSRISTDSVEAAEKKHNQEWRDGGEPQGHEDQMVALAAQYVPGSAEEKKLLRKIDLRIVPTIWLLYTLSYLNRANIGNARTGGLEAEFNLTSTQYSIVLLVFFISYVLFEIPSNLIIARVRPSIYLSSLCVAWGIVAACAAATQNWSQLAAVRFVLGITEAGFAPGVAFYLSSWYRRYELSRRFAIYYTATAVSGAFSGLLAGVITSNLDGARGLSGWRWLFLIEGVGATFCGCWAWYVLPDYPSNSKGFSEEERLLAAQRLSYDGLANAGGAEGHIGEWAACKMMFKDFRVWVFVVLYMLGTGAQTIQYFVPTLIGALGWTGAIGQYHTIPLYACAFVFILAAAYGSDYYQNKPAFISGLALFGTVCFIICVASTNHMVQYVFIIFGLGTIYATCPLILIWVPNVIGFPAQKRAVAIAFVNGMGNCASIYGVFLWPKTDAPRYIPGFSATTVFMGLIVVSRSGHGFPHQKVPQRGRRWGRGCCQGN